ncbi:MAG: NAD-dependent epimerase/dehydratase family protein [Chlamydiales bacterium]
MPRKANAILVTGSSGRIGSAIAQSLRNDYTIIGVDICPGLYTTHTMAIQSRETAKLIEQVDIVVHTAALHAPHVGVYDDNTFWDVNVRGTENLLNACLKHKVGRFIFTSSTSIYGHAMVRPQEAAWVIEELQRLPRDIYDATKLAAEELCRQVVKRGLLSCLCLRISRCFPEDERLLAIYRLYRGIDIRDVVQAHKLAITSDTQGFDILNISSQTPFNSHELNELYHHADRVISKHYPDARDIFQERGWLLPKTIDRVYVIEKARRVLGFHPSYNFKEALSPYREDKVTADGLG